MVWLAVHIRAHYPYSLSLFAFYSIVCQRTEGFAFTLDAHISFVHSVYFSTAFLSLHITCQIKLSAGRSGKMFRRWSRVLCASSFRFRRETRAEIKKKEKKKRNRQNDRHRVMAVAADIKCMKHLGVVQFRFLRSIKFLLQFSIYKIQHKKRKKGSRKNRKILLLYWSVREARAQTAKKKVTSSWRFYSYIKGKWRECWICISVCHISHLLFVYVLACVFSSRSLHPINDWA